MAIEPTSTTAGAVAGAIVAFVPGMLLGTQTDAVAVGITVAIFITCWLEAIDQRRKAFSAVALSGLLAGYFSPHVAAAIAQWFMRKGLAPPGAGADYVESWRMPSAVAIAALAPFLVPLLPILAAEAKARGRKWLARKAGDQ